MQLKTNTYGIRCFSFNQHYNTYTSHNDNDKQHIYNQGNQRIVHV